jgi:hypothetical protein
MNRKTIQNAQKKLNAKGFAPWQIAGLQPWIGNARQARRFRTRMAQAWGVKV